MGGRPQADGLPTFSPRLFAAFTWYLRRYVARDFRAVRVARRATAPESAPGPVVVYTNHPSWWDPLVMMLLHARWFDGRPAYGPMDAAMLLRYRFFARLGAFGVEQGTARGAAAFLRAGRAVLARRSSVLWITAEGRFRDVRDRPVRLAPGLAHLLAGGPACTVVPVAFEYTFWTERKPEALVAAGEPIRPTDPRPDGADAWQRLLEDRLERTQDGLAADAASRDARRFEIVSRGGAAGVGGVYDLWRRVRAAIRGERFEAAHLDRS